MMLHILPRRLCAALISFYQRTLSPDYGIPKVLFPHGFCPQHPTCSEYGKRIIFEKGVMVGGALALRRVISCHPWRKPSEEKLRKLADKMLKENVQ